MRLLFQRQLSGAFIEADLLQWSTTTFLPIDTIKEMVFYTMSVYFLVGSVASVAQEFSDRDNLDKILDEYLEL